jgi:hypothetical protein
METSVQAPLRTAPVRTGARRRLPWLTAVAVLALLLTDLVAARTASGAAGASAARLYVIQGVNGVTADVRVDGETVLAGAATKRIVGPLALAAGAHTVRLVRSGTTTTLASATVRLRAGQTVDAVAHPRTDAAGNEITAFADDLAPVAPGKLRLAVAHTAAAPPADITVDGRTLFSNVAGTEALTTVVPGGTYRVAVVPTATRGAAILGPVDLTVEAGTLTRVFAIGDVRAGTMDAVVHALPVRTSGAARPGSVPTGDGGQAATRSVAPAAPVPGPGRGTVYLAGAALAGLGLLGGQVARARRRRA